MPITLFLFDADRDSITFITEAELVSEADRKTPLTFQDFDTTEALNEHIEKLAGEDMAAYDAAPSAEEAPVWHIVEKGGVASFVQLTEAQTATPDDDTAIVSAAAAFTAYTMADYNENYGAKEEG